MALQKAMALVKEGDIIPLVATYIRVGRVIVEPVETGWSISAQVLVHASKEERDNGMRPVATDHFEGSFPADETINPLVWVYDQLKALPEYAGAVDV